MHLDTDSVKRRTVMLSKEPTIAYGLMSLRFYEIEVVSRILMVSRNIYGLSDIINRMYKKYYQTGELLPYYSVILFKVNVGNPDLLTWDILQTMSRSSWITIVHQWKPRPLPSMKRKNLKKYKIHVLQKQLCEANPFFKLVFQKELEYLLSVANKTRKELQTTYTDVTTIVPKWYYTKGVLRKGIHQQFKDEIRMDFTDILVDCNLS